MNVEIGAEAAQFPEKEYVNGIFIAVNVCVCTEKRTIYYFLQQSWMPPASGRMEGRFI